MFKEARRKNKEIDSKSIKALLEKERRGVLAVNGNDGYPYGVPINYIYIEDENKIYFHGSHIGHKADSIKNCNKVCFTVYGNETIKDESWAPYLQSVVVFGKCKVINDEERKIDILRRFASKYYIDSNLVEEEINKSGKVVCIYEIDIEYISGKEIQEK